MQTMYTANARVEGGRAGKGRTNDGRLEVGLSTPKTLGGDDGPGTNPEQLFAVGYASCFESALRLVARGQKIALPAGSGIESSVALQKEDSGAFRLGVELKGIFPGLPRDQGEKLMRDAHQVCPYSTATRGNIDVKLSVG